MKRKLIVLLAILLVSLTLLSACGKIAEISVGEYEYDPIYIYELVVRGGYRYAISDGVYEKGEKITINGTEYKITGVEKEYRPQVKRHSGVYEIEYYVAYDYYNEAYTSLTEAKKIIEKRKIETGASNVIIYYE